MIKKDNKIFFLFIIFVLLFLFSTTKYLSLFDIIYTAGQMDVISYTEISKHAPSLPYNSEIIIKHIAQRFLVPYIAGSIAYYTQIEIFTVFKFLTYSFILLFLLITIIYLNKTNYEIREKILFFSFLFLNPYIVRHHIFQPIQSHDILFFSIGLIVSYLIIMNQNKLLIFFAVIPIFLRQTAIAIFISSFIFLMKNKKFLYSFVMVLLFFISFYFISVISNKISTDTFNYDYAYGIIYYDFSQVEKLIRFLCLPLVSFFPLGIFLFSKKRMNTDFIKSMILLSICLMMIAQPILAGPDGSLRNVVRITTLCYPIMLVLLFYNFSLRKLISKNYIYYSYLLCLFFWSLHPTFSIFSFFGILRF